MQTHVQVVLFFSWFISCLLLEFPPQGMPIPQGLCRLKADHSLRKELV